MNDLTKEQKKRLLEVLNSDIKHDVYHFDSIKFIKQTDTQLLFEVTGMYEYDNRVLPKDEVLQKLAEEFGYSNYDVYDDISNSGCETCDHGSSYGKAIRFWK